MRRLLSASERNARFLYYLARSIEWVAPRSTRERELRRVLGRLNEANRASVRDRVDYYCRISRPFTLDEQAVPMRRLGFLHTQSNYWFDLWSYARLFPSTFRIRWRFGDRTDAPEAPTIVKARRLDDTTGNAILLKLNKVRHFVFVRDQLRFEDKIDRAVWRGNAYQANRRRLLDLYLDHPCCDIGHVHHKTKFPQWERPFLSIRDQLRYKFVLSLEGNDVASNLKWILASQSLCLMPMPRRETWFMEGRLEPGRHFVPLRDDFEDLPATIDYYAAHPDQAKVIIRQANDYAARFRDPDMESLVSVLVLKKYFTMSGQMAGDYLPASSSSARRLNSSIA